MGDNRTGLAVVIACLVVLLILVLVVRWCAGAPRGCSDPFYTPHGQEEPTRSYVPYTGTVPFGHWGARPWSEAVPLPRGGEHRCYGSLRDMRMTFQPLCRTCGGSRNYHDSIQKERPHLFSAGDPTELLPYQAGPYWEGGIPLLN